MGQRIAPVATPMRGFAFHFPTASYQYRKMVILASLLDDQQYVDRPRCLPVETLHRSNRGTGWSRYMFHDRKYTIRILWLLKFTTEKQDGKRMQRPISGDELDADYN